MQIKGALFSILTAVSGLCLAGNTYYVDPVLGDDEAAGDAEHPRVVAVAVVPTQESASCVGIGPQPDGEAVGVGAAAPHSAKAFVGRGGVDGVVAVLFSHVVESSPQNVALVVGPCAAGDVEEYSVRG